MASPQLTSASPHFYAYPGIPAEWTGHARAVAEQVLTDIAEVLDLDAIHASFSEFADVEDFWENAARLSAHVRAARSHGLPIEHHEAERWSDDELTRRLGPVVNVELQRHAQDPLLAHPIFLAHAGRTTTLCAVEDDADPHETSLYVAMQALRDAGHTQAVLKQNGHKVGIWSIELGTTLEQQAQAFLESEAVMSSMLTWHLPGAFSLQEKLDLGYEYRLFFVDGQLITAAGCIEEFTPFSRKSSNATAFDTCVRKHRGHGIVSHQDSIIEDRPDITERYLVFAESLGEELLAAGTGTIVVDVALDLVRDEVVIVELNCLPNSGLYASDPWLVAEALIMADDRGYGPSSYQFAMSQDELMAQLRQAALCADSAEAG